MTSNLGSILQCIGPCQALVISQPDIRPQKVNYMFLVPCLVNFFARWLHNHYSVNFAQYLQPSSSVTRGHNQRFIPICARSNIYHHSFLPSVIRMWNALPSELVSADNIEEFKSKLHICTYTHIWGFCTSNQKKKKKCYSFCSDSQHVCFVSAPHLCQDTIIFNIKYCSVFALFFHAAMWS